MKHFSKIVLCEEYKWHVINLMDEVECEMLDGVRL